MKTLLRIFTILFIASFGIGLGLELHENRVCYIKKRMTQLEIENQKLMEETYTIRKEFAELQKERNRYIIEAVRSRRIAKDAPTHG